MRFNFSISEGLAAFWLLALSMPVDAHTWVETVHKIASNGTFVGETGYMRGWIPRNSSFFNDYEAENKVPPDGRITGSEILATDLMCKSTQSLGNQTEGFPALTAAPGDQVALKYLENGHVTKFLTQQGKPLGRGTVFIYGTTKPSPSDTYLGIHRVWNVEGTGGNGNGRLLATRPFDDGRCFQANQMPLTLERQQAVNYGTGELGCQADFQIPVDAPKTGTYTVYWVWEWPFLYSNGAVQTNESYTSCLDITMTSDPVPAAGSFNTQQISGAPAADLVAIQAYMTTQFSVDPTALPQVAPDNPNPAPIPAGVEAPVQPTQVPAAGATASGVAGIQPQVQVSAAVSNLNMVTVTVTEKAVETVTVTAMAQSSSSTQPASVTTSSIPAASPSSSIVVAAGKPAVTPFLAPSKRSLAGRFFMI